MTQGTGKQGTERLNTSGFPTELKEKMVEWGQSVTPEWSLSRLIAVICQDWADNIPEFERKHQIRKKGESTVDNTEARRQAEIAEMERKLAEMKRQA